METRWVKNLSSKLIKAVSIGIVHPAQWSCDKCKSDKGKEKPEVCGSSIRTLNLERYNKAVIEEYEITDTSEENLAKYNPDISDSEPSQDLLDFFQRDEFYDSLVCEGKEFSWVEDTFLHYDTHTNETLEFWRAFSMPKDKEKGYKNILGLR